MDKDKFDYYWKIALLIALVFGMIWTIVEFKEISIDGVACKSNPFIWGAQVMSSKQPNGHMDCSCRVYGDDYDRGYYFNELEQNPEHLVPKSNPLSYRIQDFNFSLSD